jgi:charged multivesicular body protein 5
MMRILGKSKPKAPAPSLQDTSEVLEKRGGAIDARIAKLDVELAGYREQLKKTRPGPAQTRIKQKALQVLKQKRMYEGQRGILANQQWNVDSLAFTTENMRSTIDQVACMKGAAETIKGEMKKMKIDDIEKLQDTMQDLYDDMEEINDVMGRQYGVSEDIDEDDLDAELAGLDDELDAGFLDDALSAPSAPMRTGGQTESEETDPARLEQQLGL